MHEAQDYMTKKFQPTYSGRHLRIHMSVCCEICCLFSTNMLLRKFNSVKVSYTPDTDLKKYFFQMRFETILPEDIVVLDTTASEKKFGDKRLKKKGERSLGIGTTESDEEEEKLIAEAQTEEGRKTICTRQM